MCFQAELTSVAVLMLYMFTRKVPLHPRAKLAANCLVSMVVVQVSRHTSQSSCWPVLTNDSCHTGQLFRLKPAWVHVVCFRWWLCACVQLLLWYHVLKLTIKFNFVSLLFILSIIYICNSILSCVYWYITSFGKYYQVHVYFTVRPWHCGSTLTSAHSRGRYTSGGVSGSS